MDKYEVKKLTGYRDLREIWLYVDDIISSGIDIDEVLELGEPYPGYFDEHSETILNLGADPLKLFKSNEAWYKVQTSRPQDLAEKFAIYIKYGLDPCIIVEWCKIYIEPYRFIVFADEFKALGLDPRDYIPEYLKRFCFSLVWDNLVYDESPYLITPDSVVSFYAFETIERSVKRADNASRNRDRGAFAGSKCYGGLPRFIEEFVKLGGTIDLLADKILDHYGYPEDEDKLAALAHLVKFGATKVDANKIIDSLSYKAYAYKDKRSIAKVNKYFCDVLEGHADSAHLVKIR